jgi:hypothetical protein
MSISRAKYPELYYLNRADWFTQLSIASNDLNLHIANYKIAWNTSDLQCYTCRYLQRRVVRPNIWDDVLCYWSLKVRRYLRILRRIYNFIHLSKKFGDNLWDRVPIMFETYLNYLILVKYHALKQFWSPTMTKCSILFAADKTTGHWSRYFSEMSSICKVDDNVRVDESAPLTASSGSPSRLRGCHRNVVAGVGSIGVTTKWEADWERCVELLWMGRRPTRG